MYCIQGNTLAEAWEKSIVALLSSPDANWRTSAEGRCREVKNVIMRVTNPLAEPRKSLVYPFSNIIIENYKWMLMAGENDTDSPNRRIYSWACRNRRPLNQVTSIIEKLRNSHTTRTAVVSIWDPEIDLFSLYPMCPCLLNFSVRQEKLEMTSIIRSNDAWFATPINMYAFTDLQHEIARALGMGVGEYVHHAFSYHIYEYDVPKASILIQ